MNRHFIKKASIGVAILLLALSFVMTGCNEDLEKEIASLGDVASEADVALDQAVNKAAADLKAAKSELQAAIDLKADATTLTDRIEALNGAIEAAKTTAAEADAASKAELEAAITAASKAAADATAALKTELTDALADAVATLETVDADNAKALTEAIADLTAAIATAKSEVVSAALADNATLKADLEAAITAASKAAADATAALKTELTDAIADAVATLEEADSKNASDLTTAITDLTAMINAAKDAASSADDVLKTNLETKIAEATAALDEKLTKALADAVEDLETADAANTAALNTAVTNLTALIDAAKEAADTANEELKAAFEDAIAVAIAELNTELVGKIETAVEALEAADLTKVDLTTYNEKINSLEAQIAMLAGVDNALDDTYAKIERVAAIEASVEALRTAVTNFETALNDKTDNLQDLINDNKDLARSELQAEVDELVALIETAQSAASAAQNAADAAQSAADEAAEKLAEEVKSLKGLIAESADAAKKAYLALKDWNAATDAAEKALRTIKTFRDRYNSVLYKEDYDSVILAGYDIAWIKIMRATDAQKVADAINAYEAALNKLETLGEKVYAELLALAATVDDVRCTKNVRETLAKLRSALNLALAEDNEDIDNNIYNFTNKAGEVINLIELCDTYIAKYDEIKLAGEAIKADMDTVVAAPLSLMLKDGNTLIDGAYEAWINAGNEATEIDDFVATKAAYDLKKDAIGDYEKEGNALKDEINAWLAENAPIFLSHSDSIDDLLLKYKDWDKKGKFESVALIEGLDDAKNGLNAAKDRIGELREADFVAAGINNQIGSINLVNTGDATKTIKEQLANIAAQIRTWLADYGLDTEAELNQENYNMVSHALLAEKNAKFDELVGEFERTFAEFKAAYKAIGDTINLLSGDEIAAARAAYNAWRDAAALGTFDYELSGGEKPADYAGQMLQKESEFKILVEDALEAYGVRFDSALTTATITLYDEEALALIESWYEDFAVEVDGEYVFEDGYVLSETLTVTADDYRAVVALRASYETLVEAKIVETAELNELIAALGTITTGSRDAINEALEARTAWLNGTNAPEGYEAAQFAMIALDDATYVIDNATLDDANADCIELEAQAEALKGLIVALPAYTVSTDIADDTVREEYQALIDAIEEAKTDFASANNSVEVYDWDGDGDRDADDDAYLAATLNTKVSAAVLACVRYDAVEELKAAANTWTAEGAFVSAVEDVLDDATAAINTAATEEIADLVGKYSAKLAELELLQTSYKVTLDADTDAEATIDSVCDAAIGVIVNDEKNADDAMNARVLAEAKFVSITTVYAAYVDAVGQIDPADEVNLGALATAYADYLVEVEGAASEHAVTNATSAASEMFDWFVTNANA